MAKNSAATVTVVCPCCQAKLLIDVQLGAVLSHEPPVRVAPEVDIADAARILADQSRKREDKFRESWQAEKNKEDVLSRKFEEALKKAKEQPAEKPLRDFDLE